MAQLHTNDGTQLEDLSRSPSQQWPRQAEDPEASHEATAHALEPVDGGRAAWRMLLSAFAFESLLWGEWMEPVDTKMLNLLLYLLCREC